MVQVHGGTQLVIKQWGLIATQSNTIITFPLSFPTTTYSVVCTAYNLNSDASNVYVYAGISLYTKNDFSIYAAKNAKGRMWIAIGY